MNSHVWTNFMFNDIVRVVLDWAWIKLSFSIGIQDLEVIGNKYWDYNADSPYSSLVYPCSYVAFSWLVLIATIAFEFVAKMHPFYLLLLFYNYTIQIITF